MEVACDATFELLSSASLRRLSLMLKEFNSSAIPAREARRGRNKGRRQTAVRTQVPPKDLHDAEPKRTSEHDVSQRTRGCT